MQKVTYHREGDYLIPDFILPPMPQKQVGIWGQRHLRWLKEKRKCVCTALLPRDTLYSHAAEINEQAQAIFGQLVSELAMRHHITEQIKAQDQMRWVGEMNNIRAAAEESVLRELIFA